MVHISHFLLVSPPVAFMNVFIMRSATLVSRSSKKTGYRFAVPGYAQVDKIPIKAMLLDDKSANRWQDDQKLTRCERMWAAEHPKRFLASTIAIGTIDQALLSIVQTAHAHLRSVCLDRSLLVVDEVHASDYYMTGY